MSAGREPCLLCGASQWSPMPDPGPQSMASDWRVVKEPLARRACETCGLVRRWAGRGAGQDLYLSGYGLYAHPPGDPRERARQQHYADWIAGAVDASPAQVLDVGCGNGSLLLALASRWPRARFLGCDPSADSVAQGAQPGLRLWQGTAADLPADAVSDLVVSVNVIEHTHDPLSFLRALRRALGSGGTLVLICPDGGRPGLELLFADHVYSFAPEHLSILCARAGLDVVRTQRAPQALGAFQMVVARAAATDAVPAAFVAVDAGGRAEYLAAWRDLDHRLLERMAAPAVCFGAGEAAGLLRGYAPRTWDLVRACTIDGPASGRFGDLPVVGLDTVGSAETVLVGVRPLDQARLADRLRARFTAVVTWYDLLPGGDGGW
ncbi:MAG TPA: class I SAM-dependent methyltransferase [Vicinamibacterales bacterium]|nr:class I SAM-dependent methyltransferase [Vicinamibacterales bacterium]